LIVVQDLLERHEVLTGQIQACSRELEGIVPPLFSDAVATALAVWTGLSLLLEMARLWWARRRPLQTFPAEK
jgi:hypothetical protein